MNKLIVNIAVGVVIGLLIILIMNLYEQRSSQAPGETSQEASLSRDVEALEKKMNEGSLQSDEVAQLANMYLESIRVEGNAQYYENLEQLIAYDQEKNGDSPSLWALKASLAAGRHEFRSAKTAIDKALESEKSRAIYFGQKGDIALELGLYDEAIESYQAMVNMRPDFHSYTRIAHVRSLYGESEGSIELYDQAIASGAPTLENIAWAYVEMGKVQMRTDLQAARTSFERALAVLPAYAPAYAALARVAHALDDTQEAKDFALKAFDTLPTAQYAILLGDIYALNGDEQSASQQYALAETAFAQSQKLGIIIDAQYADFLSKRNLKNQQALEMASQAALAQPSIRTLDALMWSQYRNGLREEAKKTFEDTISDSVTQTVALHDASFLFHGSIILRESGETRRAAQYREQAIELDPYFSLVETPLINTK